MNGVMKISSLSQDNLSEKNPSFISGMQDLWKYMYRISQLGHGLPNLPNNDYTFCTVSTNLSTAVWPILIFHCVQFTSGTVFIM